MMADSVAANLHQWEPRNRAQRRGAVIDHT